MRDLRIENITSQGMKNLGAAVIRQAFDDACRTPKKVQTGGAITAPEISAAKMFLLGSTKAWRDSLQLFCDMADVDIHYIIMIAKQQEWFTGKPKIKEKKIKTTKKEKKCQQRK